MITCNNHIGLIQTGGLSTSYPGSSPAPAWERPGERWSRVSQSLGDRNVLLIGWRGMERQVSKYYLA